MKFMNPTACSQHGDLQKQIQQTRDITIAVQEQNKIQFEDINSMKEDIKDIKQELKGLYNGRMTNLLKSVLDQHAKERESEREIELAKAKLNVNRLKIVAGVLSPGFIYAIIKLGQFISSLSNNIPTAG